MIRNFKKYIGLPALALISTLTSAQANEKFIDTPPEPVPLDITANQLDPKIEIPDGYVIVSAKENTEANLDLDYYSSTGKLRFEVTGKKSIGVAIAPEELADTPDIESTFLCGEFIQANQSGRNNWPQTYISQSKPNSDPFHSITVTKYEPETLKLGIEFLKSGTDVECAKTYATQKAFSNMMGGIGPQYIK